MNSDNPSQQSAAADVAADAADAAPALLDPDRAASTSTSDSDISLDDCTDIPTLHSINDERLRSKKDGVARPVLEEAEKEKLSTTKNLQQHRKCLEVNCMKTLKRKRENTDSSVSPPQGWERHVSRSSGQ